MTQTTAQNTPEPVPVLARGEALIADIWHWISEQFLEPERLGELAAIAASIVLGWLVGRFLLRALGSLWPEGEKLQALKARTIEPVVMALVALTGLWTGRLILEDPIGPLYLLPLATSLTAAWILIRLSVSLIAKAQVARFVGVTIWSLAALNILGLLPVIIEVLDGATLPLADGTISVLDILIGILTGVILIWGALTLSGWLEGRIQAAASIPASAEVLISKTARIVLLALAFLFTLNASGIDLTALAVFGGALGVGIGFGLQKVVGNFISGLILLLDRSIKPGDVIETGGTYGRIHKLAARYTSVITRDGTEFLIPNEDMITQPVVNWSHSNLLVRRKIPVQVSYGSDLEQAMALMNAAAAEEGRVLADPAPRTLIKGFGADGVDLELRMWISDPENGVSNIASAVMMHIWHKFNAAGVEFPYPQRVVHLRKDDQSGA